MKKRHNKTFLSRRQLCQAICTQVHLSRRNPRRDDFSKLELRAIHSYLAALQTGDVNK
jgi:hypothetical protein